MTIDRLGPIDPISKYNKAEKTSKPSKTQKKDSISFSAEAKSKAEVYKATEDVKMAPDVRQDRIEEVKRKLQDPSYIDDKVVEVVADRIMDLFDL